VDSIWFFLILFCTGLTAGLIDAVAGGGGLITLPVLFGLGVPPMLALGTNKFQSSFGSLTATYYYVWHGMVNLRDGRGGVFWTAVGAGVGAWGVQQLDADLLNNIVPVLLFCIALYALFTPDLGAVRTRARVGFASFFTVAGLGLGFYDGFFGPGVGSFWTIALVYGLGFPLTTATGYTKLMNFASNVVSLLVFLIGGHIWFTVGLCMAAGQMLGARIGSGLVIRRGFSLIRPMYIAIVLLTTLKLLYDRFG
jgi:uncharacterized membrane protein YfcA